MYCLSIFGAKRASDKSFCTCTLGYEGRVYVIFDSKGRKKLARDIW